MLKKIFFFNDYLFSYIENGSRYDNNFLRDCFETLNSGPPYFSCTGLLFFVRPLVYAMLLPLLFFLELRYCEGMVV